MFEDDNRTLRRGITIKQRYNKTIVARCDWGPWVLYTLEGKWHLPRVPFSPSGVQNAMDLVTACNNCIMLIFDSNSNVDIIFVFSSEYGVCCGHQRGYITALYEQTRTQLDHTGKT